MAAGAVIAVAALIALAVGGGGSSKPTATTKKKPALGEPPKEDPKPVVSDSPVTPEDAPKIKNSLPTGFTDLGSSITPGSVLKLNSIDPTATDWPGVRSLPDAWQRGALNLLGTMDYHIAMGLDAGPGFSTSISPERLYNFASELDDAIKSGAVGGFGVNGTLAVQELLRTARRIESLRGSNAANRWGAAYGFT